MTGSSPSMNYDLFFFFTSLIVSTLIMNGHACKCVRHSFFFFFGAGNDFFAFAKKKKRGMDAWVFLVNPSG